MVLVHIQLMSKGDPRLISEIEDSHPEENMIVTSDDRFRKWWMAGPGRSQQPPCIPSAPEFQTTDQYCERDKVGVPA